MKTRNRTIFLLSLATVLVLLHACRKKDDLSVPGIKLSFENVVNGKPLVLGNTPYLDEAGDTFTVQKYRYYISNISFEDKDGNLFSEPESYHLIDQEKDASKTFTVSNMTPGHYVKMRFLIGVDSLRNVSGAQTGALDPINSMFWDWNSGYIMAMLEGSTPSADPKDMFLHITGFKEPDNVLRWVTLDLPAAAVVEAGKLPGVHISSDVAEWFKTPHTIKLEEMAIIVGGAEAVKYADNYADMFHVAHVE